ncbi:MAG TPA: efflux RND transporter permease subunit, partial [Planctomycetota bacterium]|nr:efflux RND transporter permease subunit [Planctomycetota bacterium]
GVEDELKAMLAGFPGLHSEVLTFLGDRLSETLTGQAAAVVVTVFGDDLDQLDASAVLLARALAAVPGAADVRKVGDTGLPSQTITLRRDRLLALGFTPALVLDDVATALQGTVTGQLHFGERTRDVVVLLDPAARAAPEQLGELLLRAPHGATARLQDLATIEPGTGRAEVLHDGGRRRQVVTCNVEGRDPAAFVADARTRLAAVPLPDRSYLAFSGTGAEEGRAHQDLLLLAAGAGVVVLLLLRIAVRSWRHTALLLTNVPFAFVGGVLALRFTGTPLSMGATVGFVTLFGITVRNSIMLVSHFRHLVTVEGEPWNLDTCIRGAGQRLLPILMTALVTSFGLLPIALGRAEAGREIEGPMALVILGGLLSSTLLNLLVLPVWCARLHGFGIAARD